MPGMVNRLRLWDFAAAQRVDAFIANSRYVQRRIAKYYRREAEVINPPIDSSRFSIKSGPRSGYVVVSRLIPYKRIDLAVQACTELNLPLTVIGDGSEMETLKEMAGPSIDFRGRLSDEQVAAELAQATAFIFTGDEDFGLTPLEAMACGTPVIALAKGGSTETVVAGTTGSFFAEQTVESLKAALKSFNYKEFDPVKIRAHAEKFDEAVFIKKIRNFIQSKLKEAEN
jgi:glycosyltransferase involved in cell wall biosynthesis